MKKYFIIFFIIIIIIVSAYIARQFTIKEYHGKIAELTKYLNQETIKQNTEKLKGLADLNEYYKNKAQLAQAKIDSLNYNLAQMHQKQDAEIIAWDEFLEFVPDPLPDVIEVVKEVLVETDIQDSCSYSYQDKNNGYSVDFNVKYDSKHRLFEIMPQRLIFEAQKPIVRKKTTIGVVYFANNSGGVVVQYRVLPFISVGGCVGFSQIEPLVGAFIGYVF